LNTWSVAEAAVSVLSPHHRLVFVMPEMEGRS
jgi:hypothetical protein